MDTKIRKAQRATKRGLNKVSNKLVRADKKLERKSSLWRKISK